jgi:hypothetical protein
MLLQILLRLKFKEWDTVSAISRMQSDEFPPSRTSYCRHTLARVDCLCGQIMRSNCEVMGQYYILTAKAKGLSSSGSYGPWDEERPDTCDYWADLA